jgi:hypothetical protein
MRSAALNDGLDDAVPRQAGEHGPQMLICDPGERRIAASLAVVARRRGAQRPSLHVDETVGSNPMERYRSLFSLIRRGYFHCVVDLYMLG